MKDAAKAALIGTRIYRYTRGIKRVLDGLSEKRVIDEYFRHQTTRKLHVGCGARRMDGWLNSDLAPTIDGVIHLDATKRFPFDDCTFDYIFSEHMIEHISYIDGQHMLNECFRVLKSGGKLRICTPDLSFLVALYGRDKNARDIETRYIEWATEMFVPYAPYAADTFVINNFVRAWGHTFIYDQKVLRSSLEQAGFSHVDLCRLNESEDTALRDLENEQRMPASFLRLESLTLEAKKS